jgi:integrase/recombinase XerD
VHERLVEEYVAWLRSWRASTATIKARRTLVRSRLKAWGLNGFTPENIAAFLTTDAKGAPRSGWTMNTYHNHLSDFCSWLVATGRLEESPMESVRKARRPKKLPRPLSDAERDRVLSVVEGQVRDWVILALRAGLRAFEIAKIRGEDVEVDGIFVRGKGEVEATLPCHPDVWEIAQRHPRTGYWFPGNDEGHIRAQQVSLGVGKLFDALGIEGSIHRCRHTYGTDLVRAGVHVRRVQQLMRHASLETTAGYTAVTEDELRDAILQLPAYGRIA